MGLLKTCLLPTTTNVTPTCFKRVFSEADCGLLNFTRVDQDLREDPELDNDGYSLQTVATVTNFDEINKFQFPADRELPEDYFGR